MLDIVNTIELNTDNATNTTAVTSYYGTAGDTAGNIKYDPFAPKQVAAQHALDDVQLSNPAHVMNTWVCSNAQKSAQHVQHCKCAAWFMKHNNH